MAERRIRVVFRRSGPGTSDESGALVSSRRPEWHPPPGGKWVRPDLNRSRQHPKLVGFLVSGKTGGPRAQTKLPHGPAGNSRMSEALKTLPRSIVRPGRGTPQPNGKTSSMSSAWERTIRRQQYRFKPSSSRTLRGASPPRVRSMNAGKALPTTLPHVKHRTGMIMGSPVRLLPLLARAASERLLGELAAGVGDDQRSIVFPEEGLEIVVVQILDEAAGDRGADRVRLAHDAAALHVHVDVDRVDFLPGELQRLRDLQAAQLERLALVRHAVDSPDAPPLWQRRQ